ncbi:MULTISPECIES: AraC family transcriptional regulator [unclassified Chryseobacterium]|uniref:helix-turn-helix domain-containing protein n=1 Tax=unclassified Chryseobacterium TaxID=2593645 RepID=UPI00226A789F|nr:MULTISPECIES: AraC family transcriptional regulator [unclassified Chryseobacterium]
MDSQIEYHFIQPQPEISNFVESFWMLENHSEDPKEAILLPDGRVDLILSKSSSEPFHIVLLGIETLPEQIVIPAKTKMFAISFTLLAVEYILNESVADLLGKAKILNNDFLGFDVESLNDFKTFHVSATQKIIDLLPADLDSRKEKLFHEVYQSEGDIVIKEISDKIGWSSRQINRYFTKEFGLSLKSYCNILRFRASFGHIKQGKLFPEKNFTDQAHFIKEVKKLAGVSPKELFKNKNDRFIQFSTLQ